MLILVIVCFVVLTYMHIETRFLKVSEVKYKKDGDFIKVAHISDIHIGKMFVSWKKLRKKLKFVEADLVILTGDYFENEVEVEKFLTFLGYIKGEYKFIVTFGNHDYSFMRKYPNKFSEVLRRLRKENIIILENSNYQCKKGDRSYNIIGIEDIKTRKPKVKKVVEKLYEKDKCNIVISHNPDVVFEIPQNMIDYVLCGHFHGKQIWMPFNFEFRKLRKEKMAQLGISRGRYKHNGIEVYINRGIGNVLFPFRFFSVPEISVYYV